MKRLKKLFKIMLIPVILIITVFLGIQLYVDSCAEPYLVDEKNAPVCDAVMVLGASVYANGTPSPVLEDRLRYAYDLYISGKAPKILVSGDHGKDDYDEVNTMRDYLVKMGVPKDDIFMDHAGFDTYDSMYRAKTIFKIERLLVSTQKFHINRAVYIARKLGVEAYGYPCEDKSIYNMPYLYLRESLAKVKAVIETDILKRSSKYGGEAIPIWKSGTLTED